MRHMIRLLPLAGAALMVAACGGGSGGTVNNSAIDNGTEIGNDPMAPDMNSMSAGNGMAPLGNETAPAPAPADNSAAASNGTAGNGL